MTVDCNRGGNNKEQLTVIANSVDVNFTFEIGRGSEYPDMFLVVPVSYCRRMPG